MPEVSWHIKGDYVLACNCDYGCPCNFNARPSMGNCQGIIAVRVQEGEHDGVPLSGGAFVFVAKWPGAIHEGGGVGAVLLDERAPEDQNEALASVAQGRSGGLPWSIFASTIGRWVGPVLATIDLEVAGKDTRLQVDGKLAASFRPIQNPVTKAEVYPKVVLPQGFAFKEGEQYTTSEFWVSVSPELTFAHPGRVAELAVVDWRAP
ncbi:MAG TPA: DUF1326 domain-containing protein [Actinomycetota bacterium]|nr:DUF1326 domain-containing protein [Actinomycetota bacterium]